MKKLLYTNGSGTNHIEVTDTARGSLTKEIATREKAGFDFASLLTYLPNPDAHLRETGQDVDVFDNLLSDGHLSGAISRRKAGTMKKLHMLDREPAKGAPKEWLDKTDEMLDSLDIQRIKSEALDCRGYGHQPIEIVTERRAQYEWPIKFEAKPPEWFKYGANGELYLMPKHGLDGILMPREKFIIPKNNERHKNPYGDALLSKCFWPVTFKRGGMRFWMKFTEKYGMPWAIAKYPDGMLDDQIALLAETIDAMIQDAILVVNQSTQAEVIQTGAPANSAIFKEALEYCDKEISKIWLGHGSGMDATAGQLGNEYAAFYAADDLIEADDQLVSWVVNQLIDRFWSWNFSKTAPRPKFLLYNKRDVDMNRANRDAILIPVMISCGMTPTPKYFEKGYDFKPGVDFVVGAIPTTEPDIPEVEEETEEPEEVDGKRVVPPSEKGKSVPDDKEGAEFSETEILSQKKRESVDAIIEFAAKERLNKISEKIAAPLLEATRNLDNYEQAKDRVREVYAEIDTDELGEMLLRKMFLAAMVGRLSNGEETAEE